MRQMSQSPVDSPLKINLGRPWGHWGRMGLAVTLLGGLMATPLLEDVGLVTGWPELSAQAAGFFQQAQTKPAKELTIYNQNFALVKDRRTLTLQRGTHTVELDDVAALIDPTSVQFKSLTAPSSVVVKEQNFRYDLINKNNILDRMVGKTIRFKKDGQELEGTLLNPVTTVIRPDQPHQRYGSYHKTTQSTFAVETEAGILLTSLSDILIDTLPEGLYPRPTLMWNLWNNRPGNHNVEVSYLSDGINWHCDYVATVNEKDDRLDITGWVTLDNQSGATYKDTKLKLVAGDVRKLQGPGGRYELAGLSMKSMARNATEDNRQNFGEESFFEYHLYSLKDPTTVRNNETKQLTLVTAHQVPVEKKYVFDPGRADYYRWLHTGWNAGYYGTFNYYANRPGQGSDTNPDQKVSTLLTLKNEKRHHLGIPLPKGKVRVYKADPSQSQQFVGEDWMDHTPEDEKVELYLGDAFDIVGEKKRTNYHKESDVIEETYEVTLRNHKKETVTVNVTDHLFGDWSIVEHNKHFTKVDAHTVNFPVKIRPKGETVVTYKVRIKRN